jgi:hypothetical protein
VEAESLAAVLVLEETVEVAVAECGASAEARQSCPTKNSGPPYEPQALVEATNECIRIPSVSGWCGSLL